MPVQGSMPRSKAARRGAALCATTISLLVAQATQAVPLEAAARQAARAIKDVSSTPRVWRALYVFGDSYSDTGAGYVDGNGPTAVAYLAQRLSIPFTYAGDPNAAGKSLNFAVSGGQTGQREGMRMRPARAPCGEADPLFGRGMLNQVRDFVQRVSSGSLRFDPNSTIFFLAGGGNDLGMATRTTVGNLEEEVRELYGVGAKYFLVALQPVRLPDSNGNRLNPAIARIPADLRGSLPDARIAVSRWGLYFDQIFETPKQFGIANTKDRCAGRALFGEDPKPCAEPNRYFFYHEGHPSTEVHRLVGDKLMREVATVFP